MRTRAYRRHQEKCHYRKRLNTQIALGRFVEGVNKDGELEFLPNYTQKTQVNMLNAERLNHHGAYSEQLREEAEQLKYKRWKYLLKNNSMPSRWDPFFNRQARRDLRHFQKMVDFGIPRGRYLVRASVMKGAPIEIDDPISWGPIKIEWKQNWWEERE
jgi:hypothetical protein